MIGYLIGRNGNFVNFVKKKCGVNVTIKKHPTCQRNKICTIEGQTAEIEAALETICAKMSQKRNPFSIERVYLNVESQVVTPFEISASNLHVSIDIFCICSIFPTVFLFSVKFRGGREQ